MESCLKPLASLLLVSTLCGRITIGVGTANIDSSSCACQRACIGDFPSPKTKGLSPVYYYNSLEGCVQLSPGCSLSSSECSYSSKAGCQLSCVTKASKACTNTQSGCCPDGTVKTEGGSCKGDTSAAEPPGSSPGMRWDLIASGMMLTVLLAAVVSVSGVLTYFYKHRHKQRQRSRYIHNVLHMYDGGSDSSLSDSSIIDDNPESNNLFQRL